MDNKLTSSCKIVPKPLQFMVLNAKPRQFLYDKLVIYNVESFSKVDKHRCSNAAFVNAFPNIIREMLPRPSWVEWIGLTYKWWSNCICTALSRIFEATGNLVPRGHDPFGQRRGSRPLARSNTGSPRFTDFPSLCASPESSLTNLIGSGLNLLCFQGHSKPECRWTWPGVPISSAWQGGPLGTRLSHR